MPTKTLLSRAWAGNDDGFGLAYGDGRRVHIHKGAMTMAQMFELVDSLGDLTKNPVIMHCRLATAGKIDAGNCHPLLRQAAEKVPPAGHFERARRRYARL